jgi:hypothetical protein
MPTDVGFKLNPSQAAGAQAFHVDQVTIDGLLALVERVKVTFGLPGAAVDVSATNPLPVSMAGAADVVGTLVDGRKTVTTPGTAVALAASSACKWVTVTALLSNTGQVNVGGSAVLATLAGSSGTPLTAGSSVTLPVNDPSKVFVDARVAGEGVSFTVGA